MRICVVGAGSIGGVIASGLAGVDGVTASVLARGATLDAIRADGLRVRRPDGSAGSRPAWRPPHPTTPAELGPQDVVIVAVKAQSMGSVAASIGPLLGPATVVLSTLNGVPWWFLDGFGGPAAGRAPGQRRPRRPDRGRAAGRPGDRRHRAPVGVVARARRGRTGGPGTG